jgi:citrate lyase subunit beta / citryl-CoA lyase
VDRARRLGFGGKLCIHPKQIEAVNRGFVLSETEISRARRVLEAAEATGADRFEGEMVDRPVIERERGYWREPLASFWCERASAG